jgi:hypothetical protein
MSSDTPCFISCGGYILACISFVRRTFHSRTVTGVGHVAMRNLYNFLSVNPEEKYFEDTRRCVY